ncbi:MAG TPA: ThuA domain-containing protein [Opitutus sp.]|nr:ThuA domain-containing protein [Opitutus sp.]
MKFTVSKMLRCAVALIVTGGVASTSAAQSSVQKEIIFLAGPKDHGMPGRHEHEKDLRILAHCLETAANLSGIATKMFVGKAPRDLAEFRNAAVIVIESSSDRSAKETHPLFPPEPNNPNHAYDPETAAYLKELDALIKQNKIGVVVFHYANWVEHWTARGYYLQWLGGLWVQMASRNPVDDWTMTPKAKEHPIFHGVQPWTYRDEVFCRFFLPDNDPKRTDLLIGTPAKSPIGPQVVSWAYQREDGGRGFVMGGVDFHVNMQHEDYRRFLLNGIVWSAGLEVPAGGVQSTLPSAQ